MEKQSKTVKITLQGNGYKYQLFEVKRGEVSDFLDKDHGVFLRNRFRSYLEEDRKRVQAGGKSRMIEFCTLVDDTDHPCSATIRQDGEGSTHRLSNIEGWKFLVPKDSEGHYTSHMPLDMPVELMQHIENLIEEYLDSADSTSIDALNGEYITFFNLYLPEGKMMLCMRSRDSVRSEFSIELAPGESIDIDKLNVLCRHAQEVTWQEGRATEYDANSLIYDSRWHSGDVHSERKQNTDYFVTGTQPTSIDGRWFESWAV